MRCILRSVGLGLLLTRSIWAAGDFRAAIFSPILGNDRPQTLLGANLLINLSQMDAQQLRSASVAIPWSDSYWPTDHGGIANRYADPFAPNSKNFLDNWKYFSSRPAADLIRAGQADLLSPAEKYDLLVNDTNWSLTNAEWNKGRHLMARTGSIPYWMGYCDGWAAASISMEEPVRPVVMPTPSGVSVTFFPQDIRALATASWVKNVSGTMTIGARCPYPKDSDHPRTLDCIQNNPASWHIAVVNQLGIRHRPIIIDAEPSVEIWNFPVYSYNYTYFNVNSRKITANLQEAIVPLEECQKDPFRRYRSHKTRYIVGVSMQAQHSTEVDPTHEIGHIAKSETENYLYDLELDDQGDLLGGEWYTLKSHPNLIWLPGTLQDSSTAGLGGIQTSVVKQLVDRSGQTESGGE